VNAVSTVGQLTSAGGSTKITLDEKSSQVWLRSVIAIQLHERPEATGNPMTRTVIQPVTRNGTSGPALSPAEREMLQRSFAEDGYCVIRNVVSRDKLADLHAKVVDEFAHSKRSGGLFSGGGLVSGHLNFSAGEAARFAYQELQDRGIIDLIRAISPQSVREPNVAGNFNLPNSVTQHFHMDRRFTNEFMIANVAVVDTDLVNGAIDVIPGTQKTFYPYWKFALERASQAHKRLPMQAGDVLVRVSNLWHRGMPNHSSVPRPMLAFTWEDGGSVHADPFLFDGGKIVFRPNWFRPSRLGRLRERTFVTAPFTYSAYRIVDSLLNNKSY
jgi:Phytanoyl-CoA dioxygenase (PhyH)